MRRFFREIEEMVRQVVVVVTIWHCCFTRYVLIHFFQQQYNRVHTTYNTGGGKEPFLVSLSSLQHQRDNIGNKYFLEQDFYFLLRHWIPEFSKIGDLAFLYVPVGGSNNSRTKKPQSKTSISRKSKIAFSNTNENILDHSY